MLNYLLHLNNGGADTLVKYIELESYYHCEKCNRPSSARCIHNLASLGNITEGSIWICDKCVIEWKRNGTKIDPTDEYLVRHEWDVKFLEKLGIGGEKLLTAKRYAVKNIKNKYKGILLELSRDPTLIEQKQKIEDRYRNPSNISKKRIKSNTEESYITNIPEGSLLYIDGELMNTGNQTFSNQTATISSSNRGKYKIKITSDYHLDFEETVDVY
jgi:hypothetical protein